MDKNWRQKAFLSPKDIAEILGVHQNTAYEIVNQLPHVMVGRCYRVALEAFEKWIRDQERSNAK